MEDYNRQVRQIFENLPMHFHREYPSNEVVENKQILHGQVSADAVAEDDEDCKEAAHCVSLNEESQPIVANVDVNMMYSENELPDVSFEHRQQQRQL